MPEPERFWNLRNDLLSVPPRESLENILKDDEKNKVQGEIELKEPLEILDWAFTYVLAHIKGLYTVRDQWVDDLQDRATVAMSAAALNFLLLARHAVLLGYYAEARGILRDCYERTSRAWLFHRDEPPAQQFWENNRKLRQSDVDARIKDLIKEADSEEQGNKIFQFLRKTYSTQSDVVHPNLQSFLVRTPGINSSSDTELRDKVGKDLVIGGVSASQYTRIVLSEVLAQAVEVAAVLLSLARDQDGEWRAEYERLFEATQKEFQASIA